MTMYFSRLLPQSRWIVSKVLCVYRAFSSIEYSKINRKNSLWIKEGKIMMSVVFVECHIIFNQYNSKERSIFKRRANLIEASWRTLYSKTSMSRYWRDHRLKEISSSGTKILWEAFWGDHHSNPEIIFQYGKKYLHESISSQGTSTHGGSTVSRKIHDKRECTTSMRCESFHDLDIFLKTAHRHTLYSG